jgi:cytochrome c-type biogenesis protein CcmE
MMSELTAQQTAAARPAGFRMKFIVGGLILLAAVAYLIISGLGSQQEYFKTVDEVTAEADRYVGERMRISGAVIGDTIDYDGHTLTFDIVHIPVSAAEMPDGGLAEVLHQAVNDPNAQRVTVIVVDQPKPDLLKHEAQAIVTGVLEKQTDGTYLFRANELLLKCPTRYEEEVPEQVGG